MSVEAMTWALRVPIGGNAKVVLLGLANHAHPDGTETFPALDTLAEYAACDRSTARRNLRKLVAEGWAIEDGHGPRGQAKFRLPLERPTGGSKMRPRQNATGGTSASEGVAPVPPEPSIEPSTSVPTEKKAPVEPETTHGFLGEQLVAREEIRAAPRVKHSGREVPRMLVAEAVRALEHFNAMTGRQCQPFTGRGKPSESLSRIIGAMLDWPAVRIEWRRMIDRSLADPWWDGPPSTGVIFGPKVVEQSLAKATSLERPAPSRRHLTPSGAAIAKLLAAGD